MIANSWHNKIDCNPKIGHRGWLSAKLLSVCLACYRRLLARVFLFSLWRYFFITISNTHYLTSLAETLPVKTNTIQWCFQNQLYWCSLYFHRCMPPRRVRTLVPWAARYKEIHNQRTSKERGKIAHVHMWVQTIAKHDLIDWFHCQNANNRSINLKPIGGSRVYCYGCTRWVQCFYR